MFSVAKREKSSPNSNLLRIRRGEKNRQVCLMFDKEIK
jgi:hypothetical protein